MILLRVKGRIKSLKSSVANGKKVKKKKDSVMKDK